MYEQLARVMGGWRGIFKSVGGHLETSPKSFLWKTEQHPSSLGQDKTFPKKNSSKYSKDLIQMIGKTLFCLIALHILVASEVEKT